MANGDNEKPKLDTEKTEVDLSEKRIHVIVKMERPDPWPDPPSDDKPDKPKP